MFSKSLTVAASSMFALSYAAPFSISATLNSLMARDTCVTYGGDGSMGAGWPESNKWVKFEEAWNKNLPTIKSSCGWNNWGDNTDDTEAGDLKKAIEDESNTSHVPTEYILAIVMQESKGCVRANTSLADAHNPGLMQGAGTASCHPLNGGPIKPCPKEEIVAMIHDGTAGEGLRMSLNEALTNMTGSGITDDSKYYKAARRYNSGSEVTDLNLGFSATPCYASDIANRLVQPGTECKCNGGTVASLTEASTTDGLPLQQNQVASGQGQRKAPVDDNVNVDQNSNGGILDTGVTGSVDGCTKYFVPTQGNGCETAGIDADKLHQLNKKLDGNCSNMWAGYKYCIGN